MANETFSEEPRQRSSLGRKLAIGLAGLLIVLIGLYFVISSGAFLKGVILPRVGKALNAEITVTDASLSPFSEVTLDNLKVQPRGAEPLLTADRVRVRYSLFSILRGNYVVNELTLTSPTIQLVTEASGRSNLDPVLEAQQSTTSSAKSDEPLRLAVRNLSVTGGTLRTIDKGKDGAVKTVELTPLNLSLDQLENGQPGKVSLTASVRLENRVAPNQPGTNDVMEGKIDGAFAFKLDPQLLPQTVTGNANLVFGRAEGAYQELAGLASVLQADVTPTEVRQLALNFEKAGQRLGRVQASGPIDLAQSEGRLKVEVQSIDRQVLNLFGAGRGWDFLDSTINATNYVDVARRGEVIGAKGQVVGRQISIRQEGQATPPLDVHIDYQVTLNLNEQSAVIDKLSVAGQQQQKDLLRASLDRPMRLTWAPASKGFAESTFQLALTDLNLHDWQFVLGTNTPSGRVDWQASVTATDDGKRMLLKSTATVKELAVQLGTNRLEQAQLSFGMDGELMNFNAVTLRDYRVEMQQRSQPFMKVDGSGNYDLSKGNLDLHANAELALPAFLRQFALPPLSASSGVVRLSSAVTQKNQKYSLRGNLLLRDFTGTYSDYSFRDFQTALDYNVDVEQPAVQVHSASLTLRRGYTSAGTVGLNGEYNLDTGSARVGFKLLDLNENALGPILAPSLGEKKLESISLSGSGSSSYDPQGDASIKADLNLTNWVVSAPQQQFVSPKLGAQMQIDGSMRDNVVDLRQFILKLAPTAKASNELQAKARLDLAKTNATPSQLTVQAESLDVTPYYQMFAGSSLTNALPEQPAPPAGPAPTPAPESEPEAVSLPVQRLTADLKIGRLYLQDLAVTNLQTTAKIEQGKITLPFDMTLNGGPIQGNAVLNLGVAGYTYDVAVKADRVPIEPLSNTFTTNAPGQYTGDLFAHAQLQGAGVTGPSLQKNLSGSLSLNLTNMTYEIVGRKAKRLLEPIALVLRVPELMQTPINWIGAKAEIGKGQIGLQQFTVQSQAFYAESRGVIPMAEVLTNSPLNLPVSLAIRRSLAEKANLVPANAPTNTTYVQLPTFVTLNGTAGDPKTDINKIVIAGLLARSIGGIAPVGEQAGTLLQGIGSALTGQPSVGTRTNAPGGTNATPAENIVQSIGGLLNQAKRNRSDTNAPASTTNKPPKLSPLDLLKLIPEKK